MNVGCLLTTVLEAGRECINNFSVFNVNTRKSKILFPVQISLQNEGKRSQHLVTGSIDKSSKAVAAKESRKRSGSWREILSLFLG